MEPGRAELCQGCSSEGPAPRVTSRYPLSCSSIQNLMRRGVQQVKHQAKRPRGGHGHGPQSGRESTLCDLQKGRSHVEMDGQTLQTLCGLARDPSPFGRVLSCCQRGAIEAPGEEPESRPSKPLLVETNQSPVAAVTHSGPIGLVGRSMALTARAAEPWRPCRVHA
ncbi:hypothetical protein HDV57DRAFT_240050 [Trichoderma longibrachiatum]|uniref:Uncharacterized protein n=1 Tax=Trichoderma longibrachiatum ATCC 18648 TaxID=983965 RepID=A0A2T4C033_TRILO|nr:hypothetical protein M440DRAFT_104804 [Trichoderma longibrachiatum ATCC 18648]